VTNSTTTENDQHLPKFLRYPEVAERFGVSVNSIKNWQAKSYKGFPKARYLGRCAVFKETEISIWAKSALTETSPDSVKHWRVK
jgi:predicted DNA-binding transcriptional regulator AlpA